MVQYVLDTNFFVQAHRMHYPFDIFPSFWNKVKELAEVGVIVSLDKVRNELVHNKDHLTDWIETNLPKDFFQSSEVIINQYSAVASWAASRSSHYTQAALNEFLNVDEADAWLVAYSLVDCQNRILITHEIPQPQGRKKIKIPEACNATGVAFMDTITMMRQIGISF